MFSKLQKLGPGLMFAGCSVGVSHIVQSTRAGALNAFDYVWIILLIHLVKYPFFEIATRYTITTNENLIKGYARIGKHAIWMYFILSLCTMFIVQAAVTLVAGSLFANLLGLSVFHSSILLLLLSLLVLTIGRYNLIDNLMKIIIIILSIATLIAVLLLFKNTHIPTAETPDIFSSSGIIFLIAFMGWMPTTVDLSVMQSTWVKEKNDLQKTSLNDALFDFNFGYVLTAVLAIAFLSLGALTMYNSGTQFSSSAIKFAQEFIGMYGQTIGTWATPIILIAALATMISTTIAVMDGYSRTISFSAIELNLIKTHNQRKSYLVVGTFIAIISICIISFFVSSLKELIDFATIVSFVIAPIFAYFNYKTTQLTHFTEKGILPNYLTYLSWFGIVFLSVFTGVFLYIKFLT